MSMQLRSHRALRHGVAALASLLAASIRAEDVAAPPPDAPTEVEVIDRREPPPPPADSPPEGSAQAGYRTSRARVGPLGAAPLLQAPFSLTVTPGELVEHRGARTVSDALRSNPAVVTLMDSGGYSSMSRVMIRGFTAADQSDMRDGLVDRSFTFVPLENVDRIEVLNGFSGLLYGFSALGGSVDYVTKRPPEQRRVTATVGVHGGRLLDGMLDVGGALPVGGAAPVLGRVVAYREQGDTFLRFGRQERSLLFATGEWHGLPGTTVILDGWYQRHHQRGLETYLLPFAGKAPAASSFDPTQQYGQPWTRNDSQKLLAGVRTETTLAPGVSLRMGLRGGTMWRDYVYVAAALTDRAGGYSETCRTSPRQAETTLSGYALLDGELHTGPVHQRITVGYTGTAYDYSRGVDVSTPLGASTIDSPTFHADPALAVGGTTTYQSQTMHDLVLVDQLGLGERVDLRLGLNGAMLQQRASGQSTGISLAGFTQRRWSPGAGLTVRPLEGLAAYASYLEGLAAGGVAPSTAANAGEQLPPSTSRQWEAGLKAQARRLDATVAFFRIDKVNEYVEPGDGRYVQEGREVHQGLEGTVAGRPLDGLTVVGGATLLDARVRKARNTPAIEGKTPVNVPDWTARVYLEYELPLLSGLTVSAGANQTGRRPIAADNSAYLRGAVTFDAGLRYRRAVEGARMTLTVNATNLFDTRYWSYFRSGDGLLLGPPRLVQAALKVEL